MKFWIARDESGLIAIYKRKPHKRYYWNGKEYDAVPDAFRLKGEEAR